MTSACLSIETLAALAAGEGDDGAFEHAGNCAACMAAVEDQQAVRELVAVTRVSPIIGSRRAELAANVLASAEYAPPVAVGLGAWRIAGIIAAGALAAAASVALLAKRDADRRAPPDPIATTSPAPIVTPLPAPDDRIAIASVPAAEIVAPDAHFTRDADRIELRDGTMTIDTEHRAPVTVVTSHGSLAIADAKLRVRAKSGAIVEVTVFAGSVELVAGGRSIKIETGDVWTAPAPVTVAPPVPAKVKPPEIDHGLGAFREGWTALRASHYDEAIGAFDRATDPVIAEDAAYWAAIASQRAGDREGALRRLEVFVARFPNSPRIEDAKDQIERVR